MVLLLVLILKVLPILSGNVVTIWNPTGSIAVVTFRQPGSTDGTISLVPPLTELIVKADASGYISVPADVRIWSTVDGAVFEAVEPKMEWRIPADATTGIALMNPGPDVTVDFSFYTEDGGFFHLNGILGENVRWSIFVHDLMRSEKRGTLIVTAGSPIGMSVARCNPDCSPIPTN